MKFILKVLIAGVITLTTAQFLPFWAAAVGILALNFFLKSGWASSFFSGFVGMGLVWALYAWILASGDATLINIKVSEILMDINPGYMFLVSGLVGALTGGISALAGYMLIKPVKINMSNNPYH